MYGRPRTASVIASLSMAAAMAMSPSASLGCGYENDVSVARGSLNWVYPDALHVVGAMAAAVAERRLPAPNFDAATPDLFGSKYRETAQSLEQFGETLGGSRDEAPTLSFSLVLVEPMLWTRFEAAEGQLRAHIHVAGPEPGDLVLVSGEAVIGEIAGGRLTVGEARRLGFIRLYGSEKQKSGFFGIYQSAERESADLVSNPVQSTSAIKPQQNAMTSVTASEAGGEIACGPGHH